MRYWFRKHCLAEVDVFKGKYGRQHRVRRLREVRKARDTDCVAGVVAVELGTRDQLESEFIILGSRDGKEGGDWRSARWVLVRRPFYGRVEFLEGG